MGITHVSISLSSEIMKRFLLGFGDTEGGIRSAPLRDICFIFIGTVELINNRFCNYTSTNKSILSWQGKQPSKSPISTQIDFLLKETNTSALLVGFWNDRHDKKVLKEYELNINTVCVMRWFRGLGLGVDGYSLSSISKFYDPSKKQKHTAFEDTLDVLFVLKNYFNDQNITKDPYLEFFKQCITNQEDVVNLGSGKLTNLDCSLSVSCVSFYCLPDWESLDLKKYDYLWKNKKLWRVRKGWKGSKKKGYKGYGLYQANGKKFILERDQSVKCKFLDDIEPTKTLITTKEEYLKIR